MNNLYLVPNTLGNNNINYTIPNEVISIIKNLKVFFSENPTNTMSLLKAIDKNIDLNSIDFFELNEHTDVREIYEYSKKLGRYDIGIISEAGCPGIADPGAEIVKIAHQKGIKVIPLTGPSSILLALIGSGLNGQNFSFNGYLPVKPQIRKKEIRKLEQNSNKENRTQIFIETPYRNIKLFEELLETLNPATSLCVASNITLDTECIITKKIEEWRQSPTPSIHKIPAIFLFLA